MIKNYILLLLTVFALQINAQGKNARLTLLNGESVEANITQAMPYAITVFYKSKITVITADSLQGFHFEGNDFLSVKTKGMEHFEFAYKLKTLDEFELYGWREIFDLKSEGTPEQEMTTIYKYIKRLKDDRLRVFEYSKAGVEEMPFLNCENMMKDLLKKYSTYKDLYELLEVYERDCGIEMRSK